MPNQVTFTKPVTYRGRQQIEVVVGEFPYDTRLLLKQAIMDPKCWDVYRPGWSSAVSYGPTTEATLILVAINLPLRQAKKLARERLLALPKRAGAPPADDRAWTDARYVGVETPPPPPPAPAADDAAG